MRAIILALSMTACLWTPSRPAERSDANMSDASDGSTMPTMTVTSSATVDPNGLMNVGNVSDGAHLVFVDNTPGKNGNLVIIGVGDNTASFSVYVSVDQGATWSRHMISPTGGSAVANLGACQDSVAHAFHVAWDDANLESSYARLVPSYVGGDISGFTIGVTYPFFNATSDSPGPRDLAEVVDGVGNHRLMFIGTETMNGSDGLFKLAVSSITAGVAPTSGNDWTAATTAASGDDHLLANNYSTSDSPPTFMASVSSNIPGGVNAPIVVVGGFPVDRKLLSWTIKPSGGDFTISGPQTLSGFGGGDGIRAHASLSVFSAPSGDVWMLYNEDMASLVPGLHIAKLDTAGTLTADVVPQPTKDPAVLHGVIATDSSSNPAVIYYNGSGAIDGTLLWDGAWLPAVKITNLIVPIGAWSISNPWQAPSHAFGYFAGTGLASPTTFSSIVWK